MRIKYITFLFSRLGLERAKTAREAIDVITALLSEHGQGGLCSEDHNFGQWTYHNAFVVADAKEAWLLETAGKFWAAKKVTGELLCENITVRVLICIYVQSLETHFAYHQDI